jgi:hypothetical protein
MQHGNKYIYQAMPRMLTIWLDMGEHPEVLRLNSPKKKARCAVFYGHKHILPT